MGSINRLQSETGSVNKHKMKKAGDMAQVVECLPSKHEALSSNPSTTHKYIYK
jgi:ornithine carbamoyltransferase